MMKINQIYTGCLAHGAYFIESEGEAAIIDPLREVHPYIAEALKNNARIKYVFETHFHADFVSGHQDLSAQTGASIVFGPTTIPMGYEAIIAKDGETFNLGKVKIKAIHTPGHTLESTCFLLFNEEGKEEAIFTGDTLFIGDVGRPDLAQKNIADLTQEKLAGHLYDSLREKILPLPDDLIVYPAHGAGSACGKNMSRETSDTLGNQKKSNYALQDMSREKFIHVVTEGLTPPPIYFPQNVRINIQGYESMDKVLDRVQGLEPYKFHAIANETGAVILDTRDAQDFAQGFIPNSINISIDGNFAIWVGTLVRDVKQEILVVANVGREEEVVTRLARVGFDYTLGFLDGGFESWKNEGREVDKIPILKPEELANMRDKGKKINILDVRKKSEYISEHIIGAKNVPLDYINETMSRIQRTTTYYVHCEGGYRSMVFNSILRARGFKNMVDVQGGFIAMKKSGQFQISDYECPTTLL